MTLKIKKTTGEINFFCDQIKILMKSGNKIIGIKL
jgi:hypothetical protein